MQYALFAQLGGPADGLDWGLPGPSWLYYAGVWLLLFAVETGVKWHDGSYPVGTFFPFHTVYIGAGLYTLGLVHYLDWVAGRVLADFRPAMRVANAHYDELRYELTTMPAGRMLPISIIGVAAAVLVILVTPRDQVSLKLATSLPSAITDGLFYLFDGFIFGVLIYHTVRQLRIVNLISTQNTKVDLFRAGPLYSLSRLTVQTAIGWLILTYGWNLPAPEHLQSPVSVLLVVPFSTIALVTFIGPLMGMHRLLEVEKGRLMGEASSRMESAIKELHRRLDSSDLGDMAALNSTLSSLDIEQRTLNKLRTWPW